MPGWMWIGVQLGPFGVLLQVVDIYNEAAKRRGPDRHRSRPRPKTRFSQYLKGLDIRGWGSLFKADSQHGKISHRYFRLHFEWPVPSGAEQIKVLYIGPKLTKS
jgi:hypothetical protein